MRMVQTLNERGFRSKQDREWWHGWLKRNWPRRHELDRDFMRAVIKDLRATR